jgi:hypothetical protein
MKNKIDYLILFCMALILFSGCAHPGGGGIPSPNPVLDNDPNFAFALPTKKCDGTALTAGTGINIWAVTGPGPMPVVAVTGNAQAACNGNKIDTSKATKLNLTLLTVTTGTVLIVPTPGVWTFCHEAADPTGNRSLIGDCLTRTVSIDPAVPTNLDISGMEIKIIVAGRIKPPTGLKISKNMTHGPNA